MDMTARDAAWYLGFMLGTSAIFWTLGTVGVEGWWTKMLIAAPSGLGIGWALQQAITSRGPSE